MESPAKMICVICDCRLLPAEKPTESSEPPTTSVIRKRNDVAALKCGHVFHEKCIHKWLKVNSTCPIDRLPIDIDGGDVVDKLYFNAQDHELDDDEDEEKPKPWYEEYSESIAFAGGAVAGVVIAGLVSLVAGGSKKKKEEPKK